MNDGPWTEQLVSKLGELWREGHSTAEIGRRLGVSKNAVVSKAHRLDLPGRESPIKYPSDAPPAARPRRIKRNIATLPALASLSAPPPRTKPTSRASKPRRAATPTCAAATPPTFEQPKRRHDGSGCCWPIGEPKAPGFRFCDADLATPSYCAEHDAKAHVRINRPLDAERTARAAA